VVPRTIPGAVAVTVRHPWGASTRVQVMPSRVSVAGVGLGDAPGGAEPDGDADPDGDPEGDGAVAEGAIRHASGCTPTQYAIAPGSPLCHHVSTAAPVLVSTCTGTGVPGPYRGGQGPGGTRVEAAGDAVAVGDTAGEVTVDDVDGVACAVDTGAAGTAQGGAGGSGRTNGAPIVARGVVAPSSQPPSAPATRTPTTHHLPRTRLPPTLHRLRPMEPPPGLSAAGRPP